ncbi:DUF2213 domain-containing protein [Enterobacter ludwigii]|uniref:DUF2213 domain-containing protein n=1 Tax=Enterobacter ludwigii TaxID=299767 RepID=UPI003BEF283D
MINKQIIQSVEVMLRDSDEVSAELLTLGDKLDIPSTKREFRSSGEMIAPCTIARTGVMLYKAKNLGQLFSDRDPESIVRVMTTPEELFSAASIESYRSCPITFKHPKDGKGNDVDVTLENNKELQKGMLEGLPVRDGDDLSGTVVINDQDTINLVDDGCDQLSSGQKALVVRVTGKGWDAEKRNIRANHIAIVPRGRAQTARILDSGEEIFEDDDIPLPDDGKTSPTPPKPESTPPTPPKELNLADVDMLQAELDEYKVKHDKVVKANNELSVKLHDAEESLTTTYAQLTSANSQIEALKVQLANEKAKNVTEEEFQRRVEDHAAGRIELLSQVAKLGDNFDGLELRNKSDVDIKREVLTRLHDSDFSDKSSEYINARFDMALTDSEEITLSDALSSSMLSGSDPEKKKYKNPALEAKARRQEKYNKL